MPASPLPHSDNFRVAYVGDLGTSPDTKRVLEMIRKEKAGLFVLLGDFDYRDDPEVFAKMLDEDLGAVPTLAIIGNHDIKRWAGYLPILERRLRAIPGIRCEGEVGVKMSCDYEGITFALSGVGTMGEGHEAFLKKTLEASTSPFKVCVWHKNQAAMQAGSKSNEVGWEAYELCREQGAMIATGHEHSYARTFLMDSFERGTVADESANLRLEKGHSFVFVSGLGGKSVRPQKARLEPYWAKVYTANQGAKASVLFCDYRVGGDPRKASCALKAVDGEIIDAFTIESKI